MGLIAQVLKDHSDALYDTMNSSGSTIKNITAEIIEAFQTNRKVYIFGNGGSAADAQHIAAEFINRFETERNPLPVLALTTDTSTITAIGNDYDFSEIFSKQIKAFGRPGDIAIGISTSGTSKNVISALDVANQRHMKTILFSGVISELTSTIENLDHSFAVMSTNTARIQEVHIVAWHIICGIVDKHYEGNKR